MLLKTLLKNRVQKVTSTIRIKPASEQSKLTEPILNLAGKLRRLDRKLQRFEQSWEKRNAKLLEKRKGTELEGVGYPLKPILTINRIVKSAMSTEKRLNTLGWETS